MQVFLPFPDVTDSVRVLDRYRLGKQRIEARQIIDILYGRSSSWENHPCVKQYRGHVNFLIDYYNASLYEFSRRGYKNIKLQGMFRDEIVKPTWFGSPKFHYSHLANLVRKALNDEKGIGAGGKSKKPTRELLDRLIDAGIMIERVDTNTPYFWPSEN